MAIFVKYFSDQNFIEPFSMEMILVWILKNKNNCRREIDNFMEYLKNFNYVASKF